jgi:hypothetical protein
MAAKELNHLKWIAEWTVPSFGRSRYSAILDYIAEGAWWVLKEQVLYQSNSFNHSLCLDATLGKDKAIGPLDVCCSGCA